MPTETDLTRHLNAVLRYALTGINQYFLHARMLKHMGRVELADIEYRQSIGTMKQADILVDRILTLGGVPNLQELSKLNIGDDERDILRSDLKLTEAAYIEAKTALDIAESDHDAATVGLLKRMSESQQEHITFLRGQLASSRAA